MLTDEVIERLEYDWPLWEIWVVRRVVGDPVWCGRRRDNHRRVLNADKPGRASRGPRRSEHAVTTGSPDILAAHREAARLRARYPPPWVISYQAAGDLVMFTAKRPGLVLSKRTAQGLADELAKWESASGPD